MPVPFTKFEVQVDYAEVTTINQKKICNSDAEMKTIIIVPMKFEKGEPLPFQFFSYFSSN